MSTVLRGELCIILGRLMYLERNKQNVKNIPSPLRINKVRFFFSMHRIFRWQMAFFCLELATISTISSLCRSRWETPLLLCKHWPGFYWLAGLFLTHSFLLEPYWLIKFFQTVFWSENLVDPVGVVQCRSPLLSAGWCLIPTSSSTWVTHSGREGWCTYSKATKAFWWSKTTAQGPVNVI